MQVQVVYCSHQTAGLNVRERLAFSSPEQIQHAYTDFRGRFPASEIVVVSTCNRVEIYTAQEEAEDPPTQVQIARFFSDFHQIPLDDFVDDLLARTGPDAVRHLFEVVSSLDSMVLGEPQIVSQVKAAYDLARDNGVSGPLTNALFQGALHVSARVRSETGLAEGKVSIASVAVGDFGKSIFDRFDDKTVLIIGAGEMAEETLRYLQDEGTGEVFVVNRSAERAERLATECNAIVKPFDELDRWMREADIIVSTTGADRPIVDATRFRAVRDGQANKPVFILDLGAPRDFDSDVSNVDDNVFLYDIDHLEKTCQRNRKARSKEVKAAQAIIDEESRKFMQAIYHQATGPVVKRLREEWHEIREEEMQRLLAKLPHLDANTREEIERSLERIINKLLHPPLKALRDESTTGTPHGLLDALRRLFHLGE
jgi:glutamyl-tRNA reductase